MKKKLASLLEELSKDQLLALVKDIYQSGKTEKHSVEKLLAAFDPKELSCVLGKKITSLKNNRRFIDYYEADSVAYAIEDITKQIDKSLLPNSPDLAIKVCQRLVSIGDSIFERADDSNGAIGNAFFSVFKTLDEAFVYSQMPPGDIADYIFEVYTDDDYGINGHIIDYMKKTLKKGVDIPLEKLVKAARIESYYRTHLLARIIDSRNDVDGYIALMREEYDLENSSRSRGVERIICNIATRLNKAFRADEAIQWLERINDDSDSYYDKNRLLVEAYRLEGRDNLAQKTVWASFERSLNASYYQEYLKYASDEEKKTSHKKAQNLARSYKHLNYALHFLFEIQAPDLAEELVLQRTNELNNTSCSLYRKLSTFLFKQEKMLAATLLRRALVTEILNAGKSKYYRYAVSDLKKAQKFSEKIKSWNGFIEQDKFTSDLYEKHKRKYSFWQLCNENDLVITGIEA